MLKATLTASIGLAMLMAMAGCSGDVDGPRDGGDHRDGWDHPDDPHDVHQDVHQDDHQPVGDENH
jgi:hypothetical protein